MFTLLSAGYNGVISQWCRPSSELEREVDGESLPVVERQTFRGACGGLVHARRVGQIVLRVIIIVPTLDFTRILEACDGAV